MHFPSVLLMSLLVLASSIVQAQSAEDAQQLVSDWGVRADRVSRFQYELVGTQTIKANSFLAYDEETGDDIPGRYYPAQDLSTDFSRETLLDPREDLFRVVTDSATLDYQGNLFKWPRTVFTWDGNTTSNQMLNPNAPDTGIPQIEFNLNGDLKNFWPHWSQIDQALCLAHGHFLAKHQLGYIFEATSEEPLIDHRDLRQISTLPNDIVRYRLANGDGYYEFDCTAKIEHRPLRVASYSLQDGENRLMFETSLSYSSDDPEATVTAGISKVYDHFSSRNQLTQIVDFKTRTFSSSIVGFAKERFTLIPPMNAICMDWPTGRVYKYIPPDLKWYQSLTFWVACLFLVVLVSVVSRRMLSRNNYA